MWQYDRNTSSFSTMWWSNWWISLSSSVNVSLYKQLMLENQFRSQSSICAQVGDAPRPLAERQVGLQEMPCFTNWSSTWSSALPLLLRSGIDRRCVADLWITFISITAWIHLIWSGPNGWMFVEMKVLFALLCGPPIHPRGLWTVNDSLLHSHRHFSPPSSRCSFTFATAEAKGRQTRAKYERRQKLTSCLPSRKSHSPGG